MSNRICELREAKGLTQEELGQIIHVSQQSIINWEKGNTPKSDYLPDLREVFGVSIDYILGLTPFKSMEAEEVSNYTGLSPESCDFLISYKKYIEERFSHKEAIDEHLTGFIASIDYFLEEMGEQFNEHHKETEFVEIDHLLDEIYQFILGNRGIYHREDRIQYAQVEDEPSSFYRLHSIEDGLKNRRKKTFEETRKAQEKEEQIRKEVR